jgi:hypothetical protein
MPIATFRDLVMDCAHPATLARFWSEVLGFEIDAEGDDPEVVCLNPPAGSPRLWLVRVPEPKTVKNRVHLDINLQDPDGLDNLLALGATLLHPFGSIPGASWAVLADPEGNEFCAFPPKD